MLDFLSFFMIYAVLFFCECLGILKEFQLGVFCRRFPFLLFSK